MRTFSFLGSEGAIQAYFNIYLVAPGSAQCSDAALLGRGYWAATCAVSTDYISYYYGTPEIVDDYLTTATLTGCAETYPSAPAPGYNLPPGDYVQLTRYSSSSCAGEIAGYTFYQENVCYNTLETSIKVSTTVPTHLLHRKKERYAFTTAKILCLNMNVHFPSHIFV